MNENDAKKIFHEVDVLCLASSGLIEAIDGIVDSDERRELRKKYAELIAGIEAGFVYDICRMYPEFSKFKPAV